MREEEGRRSSSRKEHVVSMQELNGQRARWTAAATLHSRCAGGEGLLSFVSTFDSVSIRSGSQIHTRCGAHTPASGFVCLKAAYIHTRG